MAFGASFQPQSFSYDAWSRCSSCRAKMWSFRVAIDITVSAPEGVQSCYNDSVQSMPHPLHRQQRIHPSDGLISSYAFASRLKRHRLNFVNFGRTEGDRYRLFGHKMKCAARDLFLCHMIKRELRALWLVIFLEQVVFAVARFSPNVNRSLTNHSHGPSKSHTTGLLYSFHRNRKVI